MKKVAALVLLALASVALVACGSSSDTTETTAETTVESTGAAGSGGNSETSGGSTVKIEAVPGSDLAYVQKDVKAKAGQLAIEFENPQSLSHDVAVEDSSGKEVGSTELVAGGKTVATIGDLKPGTYTFYCTVPGHREAGMEGTLTVE